MVPLWILFIFVLFILFIIHTYNISTYWKKRGIPYKRPWPIFGNMIEYVLKTKTVVDIFNDLYYEYPDAKYIGYHDFTKPIILIKDPEIIKQITVKDFDHFVNRHKVSLESIDIVFGKSLPGLHGQKWKDMRATFTPIFSSSKIKAMFILMNETTKQTIEYLENEVKKGNGHIEINIRSFYIRHINNAIASAVFGLNVDSLRNPENNFFAMGSKIFEAGLTKRLKWKLGFSFVDKDIITYFENLLFDTMKNRNVSGITRADLIQLLLELRKNGIIENQQVNEGDTGFATTVESKIGKRKFKNKDLNDEDLVAQSLVFFIAGFDGTVLSFISYKLALNPDVQEKLQQEVDEVLQKNNNTLTYEALNSMKYLDMVISETLRIKKSISGIQRVCTKNCKLPSAYENEPDIEIKVGDEILIAGSTMHLDPKYYQNPERFDPERFNDENKRKIQPYTYLPFGAGPRNCIGSRFALMEIKTTIVHLISKFKFCVCEKTEIPLKIDRLGVSVTAVNGFWLAVEPRNGK